MPALGFLFTLFGGFSTLTKVLTIAGLVVGLYAGFAIWRKSIYNEGWNDHKAAVARADAKVISDAKNARAVYLDCTARGMSWDTRTGKCSGR